MESWLQAAPGWVVSLPDGLQTLLFQLYQTFVYQDRWTWYANGLKITFLVTLGALILGVIIGMLIAVIRTAHDSQRAGKHNPILGVLNAVSRVYLTVIRGTPMMVQLLISCFVIMVPKDETGRLICGIVTLGINSGAYVAEIARSGLMSISAGQMEAGRSLGLNYRQTMWYIIIPQAIKNILPALCNEFVSIIKETSLASTFFVGDLMTTYRTINGVTYLSIEPLIIVGIIYFVLTFTLSKAIAVLERRLKTSD